MCWFPAHGALGRALGFLPGAVEAGLTEAVPTACGDWAVRELRQRKQVSSWRKTCDVPNSFLQRKNMVLFSLRRLGVPSTAAPEVRCGVHSGHPWCWWWLSEVSPAGSTPRGLLWRSHRGSYSASIMVHCVPLGDLSYFLCPNFLTYKMTIFVLCQRTVIQLKLRNTCGEFEGFVQIFD